MEQTIVIPEEKKEGIGNLDFDSVQERGEKLLHLDASQKLNLLRRFYGRRYEEIQALVRAYLADFMRPSWESTGEVEWPVSSEFEGYASDECVEFCNSHGLNSILRKCREQVENVFSDIVNHYAELSRFEDAEPDDIGHIVIRLEVKSDQATVLKQYDRWVKWIVKNLDPEDEKFFTLTFKRL